MAKKARPGGTVTPEELYDFILDHEEFIDGRRVCRTPLAPYLRSRGYEAPGLRRHRNTLVKQLEGKGLVEREHPRSGWLYILGK
jgi:hypothetical protein